MTVSYIGDGQYVGLSSDTKPTAPLGYQFYETDIGDLFISDGTYWWIKGMPSILSQKKVGWFPYGASGGAGIGLLNSMTNGTGAGSQSFTTDVTDGRYLTCITGTTTGNKGGQRINSPTFVRQFNPRMRIRFKLVSTTLGRLYIGMIGGSPTEPTGDDPYGAGVPGVTFGFISGASNFQVLHNDTTSTTVVDDVGTVLDSTTVHTLSLVADEANSRFSYKFDNNSYVHITTDIPSATNSLSLVYQNETNESGVAKSFRVFNAFLQCDK